MTSERKEPAAFKIPLSGGRVALIPIEIAEKYITSGAVAHDPANKEVGADRDVTAHSLSIDDTGASEWHSEYELGECIYTDASGMTHEVYGWHCHPLGTEYTEMY